MVRWQMLHTLLMKRDVRSTKARWHLAHDGISSLASVSVLSSESSWSTDVVRFDCDETIDVERRASGNDGDGDELLSATCSPLEPSSPPMPCSADAATADGEPPSLPGDDGSRPASRLLLLLLRERIATAEPLPRAAPPAPARRRRRSPGLSDIERASGTAAIAAAADDTDTALSAGCNVAVGVACVGATTSASRGRRRRAWFDDKRKDSSPLIE